MRYISLVANGLATILISLSILAVLAGRPEAISHVTEEPEDLSMLNILLLALIFSLACSIFNVTQALRERVGQLPILVNIPFVIGTSFMLAASLYLGDPDWPLWLLWSAPYLVHLTYEVRARNRKLP